MLIAIGAFLLWMLLGTIGVLLMEFHEWDTGTWIVHATRAKGDSFSKALAEAEWAFAMAGPLCFILGFGMVSAHFLGYRIIRPVVLYIIVLLARSKSA